VLLILCLFHSDEQDVHYNRNEDHDLPAKLVPASFPERSIERHDIASFSSSVSAKAPCTGADPNLNNGGDSYDGSGDNTFVIWWDIDPKVVGSVIGCRGCMINKLMNEFGVRIAIESKGDEGRVVKVTGHNERSVYNAKHKILKMVEEIKIRNQSHGRRFGGEGCIRDGLSRGDLRTGSWYNVICVGLFATGIPSLLRNSFQSVLSSGRVVSRCITAVVCML
jgi:KH domain